MDKQDLVQNIEASVEQLLDMAVYGLDHQEKSALLLPLLTQLHHHHLHACEAYANVFRQFPAAFAQLSSLPYLAVRMFKLMALRSVEPENVVRSLTSSGTTGQVPSRVFLDSRTSRWQSKALVKILQQFLGKQRLPMLIVDHAQSKGSQAGMTARGAGIQGLAMFGRDHTYALNEDMTPDWQAIDKFSEKYAGQPVLVFGFTFMVWQSLIKPLQASGRKLTLSKAHLFHSGGWKKLVAEQVDNTTFKDTVQHMTGISNITNFYGMAEQVGSVFMECEHGMLHTPLTADIIVRNPFDLSVAPVGQKGLIQVLSVLPFSYPGYSILTEDTGTIHGHDDCLCGRKGTYFSVHGRLPKVEIRGCSDTSHFTLGGAVQ